MRSVSGTAASKASWSTRSLKDNQLSSLLIKFILQRKPCRENRQGFLY